jgi:hypothetical protein
MAAIDPNIPNAAEKALEELKSSAIDAAVANGAVRNSVEVNCMAEFESDFNLFLPVYLSVCLPTYPRIWFLSYPYVFLPS